MERKDLINGFEQLGKLMLALGERAEWPGFTSGVTKEEYERLLGLVGKQFVYNGWFTRDSVEQSLIALGSQLTVPSLENWLSVYSYADQPKRIGIVMAGNIPLVGFHDLLCVLMSGNSAVCKLSSDDKTLLPALMEQLVTFVPEVKERIEFSLGKLGNIDGVIATGSDNSALYFEQYFGRYPHIFRKNRTSVAVLTGDESELELNGLGHDIFDHFGLGCRNVSHLLLPVGYDMDRFFGGIFPFSEVIHHKKYGNNYDYYKAVFLMNKHHLLDNNFVLLRETEELFSPVAMVHYHYYKDPQDLALYLKENEDKIQAVIGKGYIPFGQAQCPMLSDYADGVDTMRFLETL